MKKLWKEWLPWTVGVGGFILVLAVQFAMATDYTRTYDVVLGVDSPKSAIVKLEDTDIELLSYINEMKDANASTTAPTAPNEGQFWWDTGNDEMKQYYASTWNTIWSYADTTTNVWEGEIDANWGTIDNLYANTITSPYATITDVDVQTAEIGSATVGTLSTSNWSQDTAVFNTMQSAVIDSSKITNLHGGSTWADTIDYLYHAPWENAYVDNVQEFANIYVAIVTNNSYVDFATGTDLTWWFNPLQRAGGINNPDVIIPCTFSDGAGDATGVKFLSKVIDVADNNDTYNYTNSLSVWGSITPSSGALNTTFKDITITALGSISLEDGFLVEVENTSGENVRCGRPRFEVSTNGIVTYY